MSLLTVCQDAAVKLNRARPTSIFSATDAFSKELLLCAKETVEILLDAYDWQKLKTLATFTGNASTVTFDLPTDYDRMLKKSNVHSQVWIGANFKKAEDEDDWLYINDVAISGSPGRWIILGGQFKTFPAMATGETARFYYVSNLAIVASDGTTTKAAFTADSDSIRLSEMLLRLGIIWRWRAQKRMDYSQELDDFNQALASETGKDKGSRILTVGRVRMPSGAEIAYPGTITP